MINRMAKCKCELSHALSGLVNAHCDNGVIVGSNPTPVMITFKR